MKTQFLLLAAAFLFLTACNDDTEESQAPVGSENPVGLVENPYTTGQTVSADLLGRITDSNGNPVSGAMVSAGNSTTSTNSMGFYKIEGATLNESYALIKVEKSGYFDQFRAMRPSSSGTNFADIQLIDKVVNGFFNTADGGTIDIPGGPSVSFPAGNLVTSGGQPYSGEVLVSSTYLDPSDNDIMMYMPGSLQAVDEEGQPIGMVTYGMIGLELRAVNGQSLQMAGGRQATITLTLPTTHSVSAPQSIPLWYFDEEAGVWQEEGQAFREGDTYVGQVSHFTFWNFDAPVPQVLVSGSVLYGFEPTSPLGLYMTVTRPNGGFVTVELNATGNFSGYTPADEVLTLEIFLSDCVENLEPIYSAEIGPFSDDATLDPIDLLDFIPNDNSLNAFGSVIDCDGNPIENAVINVQGSGFDTYTTTNENGEFSFLLGCVQSGTLNLNILDPSSLTASEEGAFAYNVASSNDLSFGDIVFCDEESIPDFITYSDGFNQITFEEVSFDPNAPGCTDLEAFNLGSPIVDVVEGIQVELTNAQDSIGFAACGDQQITVKGYLPSGEYLVFESAPGADYFISGPQITEGEDATLYAGMIFLSNNEAYDVFIYEDETMAVQLDQYVTEGISLTYQLIW
jgi:hypothetical protein